MAHFCAKFISGPYRGDALVPRDYEIILGFLRTLSGRYRFASMGTRNGNFPISATERGRLHLQKARKSVGGPANFPWPLMGTPPAPPGGNFIPREFREFFIVDADRSEAHFENTQGRDCTMIVCISSEVPRLICNPMGSWRHSARD